MPWWFLRSLEMNKIIYCIADYWFTDETSADRYREGFMCVCREADMPPPRSYLEFTIEERCYALPLRACSKIIPAAVGCGFQWLRQLLKWVFTVVRATLPAPLSCFLALESLAQPRDEIIFKQALKAVKRKGTVATRGYRT